MRCPEISLSKSLCNWGYSFVSRPYQNKLKKSVWHCFISEFSVFPLQFALLCINIYTACGSQVHESHVCHSDIWIAQWVKYIAIGQQVWPTFNSGSDTNYGMRIYDVIKIISYTKLACKDSQNLEAFWIIVVQYRLHSLC